MPLTAEQIEARGRAVGGSDVATILGLNPYKTPLELYHEKRGELEPEDLESNDLVFAGNNFEDGIAKFYERRTGNKVRNKFKPVKNDKYPWLVANIDRDIVGVKKGLEIKNVSFHAGYAWGKDGTEEVAEYYIPQPNHYMLVMDYDAWDVAAYFGGQDLRIYTLERDREWDEIIIETTHTFWYDHVMKGVPPELDYSHAHALDAIQRIFPGTNGETIQLPDEIQHWHEVMQQAKAEVKRYETVVDGAKAHILHALGDNAVGLLPGGGEYTRKKVKRNGFTVEPTEYMDFRFKKGK